VVPASTCVAGVASQEHRPLGRACEIRDAARSVTRHRERPDGAVAEDVDDLACGALQALGAAAQGDCARLAPWGSAEPLHMQRPDTLGLGQQLRDGVVKQAQPLQLAAFAMHAIGA